MRAVRAVHFAFPITPSHIIEWTTWTYTAAGVCIVATGLIWTTFPRILFAGCFRVSGAKEEFTRNLDSGRKASVTSICRSVCQKAAQDRQSQLPGDSSLSSPCHWAPRDTTSSTRDGGNRPSLCGEWTFAQASSWSRPRIRTCRASQSPWPTLVGSLMPVLQTPA